MASEISEFVLRLISITVLARLLLPEHFGLVSMVMIVTSIAEQFRDLGLSTAAVQQKEISHQQISNLFWINLGISLVLMLGVCSLAPFVAWFYHDNRLVHITLATSLSFLWGGLAIQHQAMLRRQMRFKEIAAIRFASSMASMIVAIALAQKGYAYWSLVWAGVTKSAVAAGGAWVCNPWMPGLPSRGANIGSMLRFGRNLTAFNLVYYFTMSLDQVIIGKCFGQAILGAYRQAYQLVVIPVSQLVSPVQNVAESALCRLQDDPARYRRYYHKLLSALSFASVPLILFLIIYAKEIIGFMLGEKWLAAADAFRILAIAALLRPAASTAGFVMISSGKSGTYLYLGLLKSLALAGFFLIGVSWGPLGVAFGHVAAMYLLLIPNLYYSFRKTPVSVGVFFAAIARPFAAGLLMSMIVVMFRASVLFHHPLAAVAAGLPVAMIGYLLSWTFLPGGIRIMSEMINDFLTPLGLSARLLTPLKRALIRSGPCFRAIR